MEFVGFALAVIGFVLAGVIFVWSRKQAAAALEHSRALEEHLEKANAKANFFEKKVLDAESRVAKMERVLGDAIARRDQKAMAATLWELELERSYRQWRDVIVPTNARREHGDITEGQQLAFAVSQEVERLREEVGVAIRFDGGLDLPLDPELALGALRMTEELLALAAKKSEEVVVSVDQGDEPSISIVVQCHGWEAGVTAGEGALEQELGRMAESLQGSLLWTSDQEGNIRAALVLPAPEPERAGVSSQR